MRMFEQFAGLYFDYLSKSFFTFYPTSLAKIIGAYRIQVVSKNSQTTSKRRYFFVMENLFVNMPPSKKFYVYDLKGSKRHRFSHAGSKTFLDNNFCLDFDSMPLPLDFQMQNIMNICFANDSLFLQKCWVIDYSLLLVLDLENLKMRVGIIDYIQQYTIDKQLENRVKSALWKEKPTIINPNQYKVWFREAMQRYFVGLYDKDT